MRAYVARHRAEILQVAGVVLVAFGVAFAFGYAFGLVVAGTGALAYGIAKERE